MGRGRGNSDRGQRDDPLTSLDDLLAPIEPLRPIGFTQILEQPVRLIEVEDARRWSPYDVSPRTEVGTRADLRIVGRGMPSHQIGFSNPEHVVRCVRRQQRREVLFAKRKRRKGAGASRRRRNYWSNVKC